MEFAQATTRNSGLMTPVMTSGRGRGFLFSACRPIAYEVRMRFYLVAALWEGLANSTAATPALKRVARTLIRNSVGEIFILVLVVG